MLSYRSCRFLRRPHIVILSLLFAAGTAWEVRAQLPEGGLKVVEEPAGDPFAVPEDLKTAEECFNFIEKVAATEPADETEPAMIAHQRKLAQTVVQITEKALTLKPTDEETMRSIFFKLQALGLLAELGEAGADEQFAEAVAAARDDARPDIQAVGMKFYVETGFSEWPTWNQEQKQDLIAEIISFIKRDKPNISQLRTLLTVLQFLEAMDSETFAKPMLAELIPHFQSSDDENIQAVVAKLEGTIRRLNLPGNPIEITGTLLDGNHIDWASYRGKVVLVDFWATWCQPCRDEVPNVLNLYKAYHDKGFEVVGVSLDQEREQAESYIKQYEIPWVNIFSENEAERFWEQPLAVYYGITAIPRAILVDRDGKVVSLNARGKILKKELHQLLGEPVASADALDDSLVQQVDAELPAE